MNQPMWVLRDVGNLKFGFYKIFKREDTWMVVIQQLPEGTVKSAKRRSFKGCLNWIAKQDGGFTYGQ